VSYYTIARGRWRESVSRVHGKTNAPPHAKRWRDCTNGKPMIHKHKPARRLSGSHSERQSKRNAGSKADDPSIRHLPSFFLWNVFPNIRRQREGNPLSRRMVAANVPVSGNKKGRCETCLSHCGLMVRLLFLALCEPQPHASWSPYFSAVVVMRLMSRSGFAHSSAASAKKSSNPAGAILINTRIG